jgi:hypothetical protein
LGPVGGGGGGAQVSSSPLLASLPLPLPALQRVTSRGQQAARAALALLPPQLMQPPAVLGLGGGGAKGATGPGTGST